jgi:hypothetical protein
MAIVLTLGLVGYYRQDELSMALFVVLAISYAANRARVLGIFVNSSWFEFVVAFSLYVWTIALIILFLNDLLAQVHCARLCFPTCKHLHRLSGL